MLDNIFIYSALIGGAVLAFQFVMMLFGMAHHGGDVSGAHGHLGSDHFSQADPSGHDLSGHDSSWQHAPGSQVDHSFSYWFYEVISLRTLSAAATFFGLVGVTARAYGYSGTISFALAGLVGLTALYCVYWLFKQVYKVQNTGTENIRNALGAEATVYVPIPGKRSGAGKVTFRLQNRLVEYVAITEEDDRLATGEKVVVVDIVNSSTVRVARTAARVPNMASST